ncbi:glycine dehydrogenase [Burkholderia sp. MSMB617WGS]|uniref:Glycine dehydrogenase n=1 Tax=Burkholderia savannae TaxID=1637837 RepID=A0ABR5TCD2_9BURK|nr:glycine dehydrogenase [Burkholderia savannae]AOK45548.1 glycine dehydrogenase [Burkholderia sp. MSMB617WGS]KVG47518.1 glycine dehydrogenase [Burkholderia sp. MSMB0265]KVG82473.1 glycine dehydrogenase [Burkholderia sp. MSMB2040]KVG92714.1 glycine dehydrogenase [Burkholderia sp. MSMB2041]KVG98572.1 glycine dehydrogenase [Burkholderia sp. MSMB2042]KVK77070.1 glycine dehydrogenase [Burkholderia sp. MSMB1498]
MMRRRGPLAAPRSFQRRRAVRNPSLRTARAFAFARKSG